MEIDELHLTLAPGTAVTSDGEKLTVVRLPLPVEIPGSVQPNEEGTIESGTVTGQSFDQPDKV